MDSPVTLNLPVPPVIKGPYRQLAEAIGEPGPHGVQRLLNAATWDAEGVRDDLRAYVVEHLGDAASGVLIVDETSVVK